MIPTTTTTTTTTTATNTITNITKEGESISSKVTVEETPTNSEAKIQTPSPIKESTVVEHRLPPVEYNLPVSFVSQEKIQPTIVIDNSNSEREKKPTPTSKSNPTQPPEMKSVVVPTSTTKVTIFKSVAPQPQKPETEKVCTPTSTTVLTTFKSLSASSSMPQRELQQQKEEKIPNSSPPTQEDEKITPTSSTKVTVFKSVPSPKKDNHEQTNPNPTPSISVTVNNSDTNPSTTITTKNINPPSPEKFLNSPQKPEIEKIIPTSTTVITRFKAVHRKSTSNSVLE